MLNNEILRPDGRDWYRLVRIALTICILLVKKKQLLLVIKV